MFFVALCFFCHGKNHGMAKAGPAYLMQASGWLCIQRLQCGLVAAAAGIDRGRTVSVLIFKGTQQCGAMPAIILFSMMVCIQGLTQQADLLGELR